MRSETTKQRLNYIIHADKEEMNDVTREAIVGEFARVAKEYFDTDGDVELNIKRVKNAFEVSVRFHANRVKNFTMIK